MSAGLAVTVGATGRSPLRCNLSARYIRLWQVVRGSAGAARAAGVVDSRWRGGRGGRPIRRRRQAMTATTGSNTGEPRLPSTAEIVVVGAGVVGCSVAYYLAERGATGVVVLERDAIGAGTPSKGAGGFRAPFAPETETRFPLAG